MEAKNAKIQEDLGKLILSINKNASHNLVEDAKIYANKIIGSTIGKSMDQSPQEIRQKVIIKVSKMQDNRGVLQCEEATQRFLNSNAIFRKAEVLKMLLKLSEALTNKAENPSNIFKQIRNSKEMNATIDNSTLNNSGSVKPTRRQNNLSMEQLHLIRDKGSFEDGLSENEIVRQVLFILNNTRSADIEEHSECFKLRGGVKVSENVRKMISELCDLGWLHKQIMNKSYAEEGTISKALKLAVQNEMNEYLHWVGFLQKQLKKDQLSLRKLIFWSYEPMENLRWLATVLQAADPFQGCQIISIINSYRPHGSTPINQLLNRLLGHLLQPLLQYIYNWCYKGELFDHQHEFFILENKKVNDNEEWTDKYTLIRSNVPNILDKESANMILSTGKSIYFLKNKCNYNHILSMPFIDAKSIMSGKLEESTSLCESFSTWIRTAYEETNAILVQVLLQKFHLKHHIQSMKNFFLLGKGDVIQHLLDNLQSELEKPKAQIIEHNLDSFIEEAFKKCLRDFRIKSEMNEKGMSEDPSLSMTSYIQGIASRLLAKKIEYGVDGWDSFNFQYSLEGIAPIKTIISPEIIINYQKIFYFLWKVKRIEELLKSLWINQTKEFPKMTKHIKSKEILTIFHYCYVLRNNMNHFLSNFLSFLMITIEASWNNFEQHLKEANNFDQILKLHRQFQNEVLEISLNTPKGKQISQALANIFSVITKFKATSLKLQSEFDDYYEKKRRYEDRREMMEKGIEHFDLQLPEFSKAGLLKEIKEIRSCYDTAFKNFYLQIRKENQLKLNVLWVRLDFSEYYTTNQDFGELL